MKTTLKTLSLIVLVACLVSTKGFAQQDGFSNELLVQSNVLQKGLTPSASLSTYEPSHSLRIEDEGLSTSISKRRRNSWNTNFGIDKYYPRRGTENFVNVYVGLNNWLEDGDLPNSDELYSLIPINSWYLGLNFDNVTHVLGPLFLDWGIGASMQDYAFENTRVEVIKQDDAIQFQELADITGRKSKINVSYLNVHFVPTFSFGRYRDFRVGFGVYGGYRISSNTKMKYDDASGDKQKDKVNDSFHINPFKYGFRAQIGWDFFDMFFNYDLTEFFDEDINAPRLTPVTFGVIF
ncbi:outer membrane beta-barrel protein [Roseivirga sp.]|uniref:outer membrane beta-barrel protein n=1 Tax=Roseivirga sp. TaxID=1964215 RepID=UPI003B529412